MSCLDKPPTDEKAFIERMLGDDAKNYHVWSYRQWLIRHFELWQGEVQFTEYLIGLDVRNNSAWNHRFFVIFEHGVVTEEVIQRESLFAKNAIGKDLDNKSPWSYLQGYQSRISFGMQLTRSALRKTSRGMSHLKEVAVIYASTSVPAMKALAQIYETEGNPRNAVDLYLQLETCDSVRQNYWRHCIGRLKKDLNYIDHRSLSSFCVCSSDVTFVVCFCHGSISRDR